MGLAGGFCRREGGCYLLGVPLWGLTAPLGLGASPLRGRRIVATSAPDESGAGGGRSSLGMGTPRHPRWIPP